MLLLISCTNQQKKKTKCVDFIKKHTQISCVNVRFISGVLMCRFPQVCSIDSKWQMRCGTCFDFFVCLFSREQKKNIRNHLAQKIKRRHEFGFRTRKKSNKNLLLSTKNGSHFFHVPFVCCYLIDSDIK